MEISSLPLSSYDFHPSIWGRVKKVLKMEGGKLSLGQAQRQSHVPSSQLDDDASNGCSPKRVVHVETEAAGIIGTSSHRGRPVIPTLDPKKFKRALANRQYARKNRLKKLHYIGELEGKLKDFQAKVETLSPQVKKLQLQCSLMSRENISIRQKISNLTDKVWFQEDEYKELKLERDILKSQVHFLQQQQLLGIMAPTTYQPGVMQHMVNPQDPIIQPLSSPALFDGSGAMPNMNWEQCDSTSVQASDFNFLDQDPFSYNYLT